MQNLHPTFGRSPFCCMFANYRISLTIVSEHLMKQYHLYIIYLSTVYTIDLDENKLKTPLIKMIITDNVINIAETTIQ